MPSTKTLPLIKDAERLESRLKEIPAVPGVYLMRDESDRILYIGKSKKLRNRVRSYFRESQNLSPRIAMMVQQVREIEFIATDTEAEALALEANLVKQHQPHFNVLLKDDKKYPYLCITWSEKYPRIFITRKRRAGSAKDRYYGPYVDTGALRSTLHLIKRIFPLRQRPQPLFKDRPCLNYDIGRCVGVCQGLMSAEDYQKIIQKVAMIFQGRTQELLDILEPQMEQAAEDLNFETAARIRDQIKGLQSLSAGQKVSLPDDTVSRDAIALAADTQHACIQLFQIRAGQLVGRLGFMAEIPPQPPLAKGGQELSQPLTKETQELSQPAIDGGQELSQPSLTSPPYQGGERGGVEAGAILQRVLEEHYQNVEAVEIPSEISVQYDLPEGEILADWLSNRKGRKVTILTPQRQTKAELIEMVERNAEYELARMQRLSDRNSQAMQDLAEILDLPEMPHRIEGYDISHIQGSDAVASRVVFIDGLPANQHYRHYKIKNPEIKSGHSDDFASLAEVIGRRFRLKEAEGNSKKQDEFSDLGEAEKVSNLSSVSPNIADKPDLIMIDGGKGQLSAVVAVLREMNLLEELRVVSLAKQREEIFLPGESLPLPTNSEQPGVQLLRRVRDEAHRFAVSFHRDQRSQRMKRSRLDDIPGLGHHRQKLLLAHFRSIDYLRLATPEQLAEVSGIGPRLAQQIYAYFHP
ncbi:MAG: excinuclease ABC subunit UvrC [Oscillatoriales cyanobacterium]|uniref:excinuclease ABC subunit UvrC n=1 Tax=Microcoleus sp. PH2017_05_CCC_O_A TaxID=2798816 RepID=UPI001D45C08A|nr:excinuclease ABC subunit UvrC [Microcoleus sp. PH2017_05_CCC_O_A]TAG00798.1 MAG: excinuclease ABC subunit UvrC [Oscillatoriales cyanobacterium]MCC3437679.1 excinuclease ABC subunit UvrC [Microcoleus sp. PH2017_05_CCC_O_A]TAG13306.1 MAG: excinuclease ABC subunit UvrC [Oscillatoriales cyanobacterium]TAG36532.1 MAG: excinuclease ABC subunit UvrC [Oscillatoriales cyanobacterium]TAG61918.1 MAG: excinuclease ABC subunit UvrC [Oscillatoriales cyanobacterium]